MRIDVNGTAQSGINATNNVSNSQLQGVDIRLYGKDNVGIKGGTTTNIDSQATIQNTDVLHTSNSIGILSSGTVTNSSSGLIDLYSDEKVVGIQGSIAINNGKIIIKRYNNANSDYNIGVFGSGTTGTATNNNTGNINVSGRYYNAGLLAASTVTNKGSISVSGSYSDGIRSTAGDTTSLGIISVSGSYNNGVRGHGNATLTGGSVTVTGFNNNGVYAETGNISITGTNGTTGTTVKVIGGTDNNGVYAPNGSTTVNGTNTRRIQIYVGETDNNTSGSNGINLMKGGATNSIIFTDISMAGDRNIGIKLTNQVQQHQYFKIIV